MAIKKKFIGADQVGAEKIQLENEGALVALNAAGSSEVSLLKLDSSDILKFLKLPRVDVALGSPSDDKDLTTKEYVDDAISNASLTAFQYLGTWDASNNTPALADGTGGTGDVYHVSVGGTQNLGSGALVFQVGDKVVYNGATWEKWDTIDQVTSVNGELGDIVLTASDIDLDSAVMGQTEVQAALGALETEDLSFLKLDGSRPMTGDLNLDSNDITQVSSVNGPTGDNLQLNADAQARLTGSTGVVVESSAAGSELTFAADGLIARMRVSGTEVKIETVPLDLSSQDILNVKSIGLDDGVDNFGSVLNEGGALKIEGSAGMILKGATGSVTVDVGPGAQSFFINKDSVGFAEITSDAGETYFQSEDIANFRSTNNKTVVSASSGYEVELSSDTGIKASAQLDMTSHKIVNVTDPTDAQDAATKAYVDGEVTALENEDLTFVKLDGSRPMTDKLDVINGGNDIILQSGNGGNPYVGIMNSTVWSNIYSQPTAGFVNGFGAGLLAEIITPDNSAWQDFNVAAGRVMFGAEDGVGFGSVGIGDYEYTQHGEIVKDGSDMKIVATAALKLEAASQVKSMVELSMESAKIVNVADPVSAQDAATKAYVDGELDSLSVQELVHQSITLTSTDITNQYVDVSFTISGQPWVQVGRVSLVPTDDFTVSGARITFAGDVATGGPEALEAGDKLSIFYMKSVQPYV